VNGFIHSPAVPPLLPVFPFFTAFSVLAAAHFRMPLGREPCAASRKKQTP
jgi:hypothetical protein